jgi:hypothetical protein
MSTVATFNESPTTRYLFRARVAHRVHLTRLTVVAQLYKCHNETEAAKGASLDADILRLEHAYFARFGARPPAR